MQFFAVITSDLTGTIPDFGKVGPDKPLIVDDFKMVRIEAKRRLPFGLIQLPVGVKCTMHILEDDEELDLEGSEQ